MPNANLTITTQHMACPGRSQASHQDTLCCSAELPTVTQYVVETRFTGQEHEVAGAAQQQIVGHQERIIPGPPAGISPPPPAMPQPVSHSSYSHRGA